VFARGAVVVVLELNAGPLAAKKITAEHAKSILVGRAPDHSKFTVRHDSFTMSMRYAWLCTAFRSLPEHEAPTEHIVVLATNANGKVHRRCNYAQVLSVQDGRPTDCHSSELFRLVR
jgi:hypothetical protein